MTRSRLAPRHKIHKYQRVEAKNEGKSAVYRCVLPGCKHYLREEFIVGQIALCYECNNEFEITKAILSPRKIKKVHCQDCVRPTFNKRTGKVQSRRAKLTNEEIMSTLDAIISGKV